MQGMQCLYTQVQMYTTPSTSLILLVPLPTIDVTNKLEQQ